MKKGKRLIKRAISLLLVLLFSIESFAAIVSDNDGSAFITKAEFDSLKNDFQSQIDNYNTSIDSKIDGAIAAYLAGIKVAPKSLISINSNDEQFMFMDPNQKNYYKTFQGSMGMDIKCIITQKRSSSTNPNLTAMMRLDARITATPFTYAVCRDKNNDLWLYKNLEAKMELICNKAGNYLDSPSSVANLKAAVWIESNPTEQKFSTGAPMLSYPATSYQYVSSAKLTSGGSTDDRRVTYNIYYCSWTSNDVLVTKVSYKDGYTDNKIRVLSTAKAVDDATSSLKKHIPAIDMTKLEYYPSGYTCRAQPNNSRYAKTSGIKFSLADIQNSYQTSWESSSAIGTSTSTWFTDAVGKNRKNMDFRDKSILPPIKDIAWDESTNVKNSNGDKLKFNDGYLFFKKAPSNGEVECIVNFDEKTTKVLNCFITNKPMNLSNRDTTVKKIPITYNGTTYKDNASFKSGITQAKFKFKVEKGLDYYFFGCHSDGSGPIFKFENDAWIVSEE